MKMKWLLIAAFCMTCCIQVALAQAGIKVAAGTSFSIISNTTVSIDGLVLVPSTNYSIDGDNYDLRKDVETHTPVPMQHIKRFFPWTADLAPFTGTVTIYYDDTELNGLSENELILYTHDNIWNPFATGTIRDGLANYVTTLGLSNIIFNELTLGKVIVPLPLQWGTVTAYRKNQLVLVEWQTRAETNTSHFIVESSLNTSDWKPVGEKVNAKGIAELNHYSQVDLHASNQKTFYRIMQVDINGKYSYSTVVTVLPINSNNAVLLYPNPANNTLHIRAGESIQYLLVRDAAGKLVMHKPLSQLSSYELNIQSLPAGMYYLEIIKQSGSTSTHSFIKK
ncbi:hypothetical protein SY85_00395 [Flavisolibacter tropicus]|uniref:Secretion system C-terminal sorting domain-containing protein n=2 Tax=Flavisolibacter tropicus TaxID=1492898 RepID=A0A172TQ37_9BACT|nr:hypothetical protein SY85_00395 [Flavisolibacter tropicus]